MKAKLALSGVLAAVFLMLHSHQAKADDWPCEALLCLSNPGGATQYSQCVPPMQELWQWLSQPGHSFPQCPSAGPITDTAVDIQLCPENSQDVDGTCEIPFNYTDPTNEQTVQLVAQFAPTELPYDHEITVNVSGGQPIIIYSNSSFTSSTTSIPAAAPPVSQSQIELTEEQVIAAYRTQQQSAFDLGGNGG